MKTFKQTTNRFFFSQPLRLARKTWQHFCKSILLQSKSKLCRTSVLLQAKVSKAKVSQVLRLNRKILLCLLLLCKSTTVRFGAHLPLREQSSALYVRKSILLLCLLLLAKVHLCERFCFAKVCSYKSTPVKWVIEKQPLHEPLSNSGVWVLARTKLCFVRAKVSSKRGLYKPFGDKKKSLVRKAGADAKSYFSKKRNFWSTPFLEKKRVKNVQWSQLFTWTYFLFFLILPICALIVKAGENRFVDFIGIATQPIALSAYSVTFSMAAIASLFNAFFGFVLAWVLVRYNFPFKRFLDAAIDLPFAVPTSVAGLTLATVYSPQGWIGETLQRVGIQVVYTRVGVATAMVFVSLPFVVRSLQPVLQEIDEQIEEAALSLGASPYTTFRKVLAPPLLPAFLTGVTLGFSRAIGEYGSLVLVSSNIPYKDLIASVLIFQNLESYSLGEATVIATVVLFVSFSILLGVSSLQSWSRNKQV